MFVTRNDYDVGKRITPCFRDQDHIRTCCLVAGIEREELLRDLREFPHPEGDAALIAIDRCLESGIRGDAENYTKFFDEEHRHRRVYDIEKGRIQAANGYVPDRQH